MWQSSQVAVIILVVAFWIVCHNKQAVVRHKWIWKDDWKERQIKVKERVIIFKIKVATEGGDIQNHRAERWNILDNAIISGLVLLGSKIDSK